MALLISDCPRCHSTKISFDVQHAFFPHAETRGRPHLEVYGICRNCDGGTIFLLHVPASVLGEITMHLDRGDSALVKLPRSLNNYCHHVHPLTLAEVEVPGTPEHVPEHISDIYVEAQKVLSIDCFNASGAMSRLTLDLATKQLLAANPSLPGINARVRDNLAARLTFLIDSGVIPAALADLANHVRLNGNDAAHDGTLDQKEAMDLIEFSCELLRTCFEVPGRVKNAQARRDQRRNP